jgi:hypothetical protein
LEEEISETTLLNKQMESGVELGLKATIQIEEAVTQISIIMLLSQLNAS